MAFAVGAVSVFVLLLGAQAAAAATRYTAPAGHGTSCTESAPCAFYDAVNEASGGDQVIMLPGTYEEGAVRIEKAISVGGQPGTQPPTLKMFGSPLVIENSGANLHDLRLELGSESMGGPLDLESGTVERIYATSSGLGGNACFVGSGLIRNSVCATGLQVEGFDNHTEAAVRNVTAVPLVLGASGDIHFSATIFNTVVLPEEPGKADVIVSVGEGASGAFDLSHSLYTKVDDISSSDDVTVTKPGTNGNITAPPLLVNPAAGDFRELPGSPTIAAGIVDPLIGSTDLAGAPRVQPPCPGAVPDIGAYELANTTPCPTAAVPISAPAKARVKFGRLKRNLAKGTAVLSTQVSGPGKLVLAGKGLAKSTARSHGVETVKLKLKANGKKLAKLQSAGAVSLKAKVTFTPAGGAPVTATKKLKLKLRP